MTDSAANTSSASDGHQAAAGAATPGSTDGSGGAQAGADTFAAEREQFESRYRSEQGRADREATRARELEAQLAALKGSSAKPDSTAASEPLDADALFDRWEAKMAHRDTMRSTADALKGEFDYADADIFEKSRDFDSPEALRAAVENSHTRVKSIVDKAVQEREAQLVEEVAARHGIRLSTAPASSDAQAPAGDPSLEQLGAMSQAELDAAEASNPGVIDRVLRTAY